MATVFDEVTRGRVVFDEVRAKLRSLGVEDDIPESLIWALWEERSPADRVALVQFLKSKRRSPRPSEEQPQDP